MLFEVQVVSRLSRKVEKVLIVKGERTADKVANGMQINLNNGLYFVRIVKRKERPQVVK